MRDWSYDVDALEADLISIYSIIHYETKNVIRHCHQKNREIEELWLFVTEIEGVFTYWFLFHF